MDASIDTVKDLIAALGGAPAVAAATKADRNTVIYWGRRDRIPVEHWDAVIGMGAASDPPVVIDHAFLLQVCRARKHREAA